MKNSTIKLDRFTAALISAVLATWNIAMPAAVQAGIIKEEAENTAVKTGIRYWIELKRGDKTFKVTNAQNFKTGDKIRFHVQPTVDGYAYIVLRSGSQGEQAVLFPQEGTKDDNRLHHQVDYPLPADDYMTFDANPGTEKVTLLFSKHEISASQLLATSIQGANHIVIRSTPGSKDLVPAHTHVTYQPAESQTVMTDDGEKSDTAEAALKLAMGDAKPAAAATTADTIASSVGEKIAQDNSQPLKSKEKVDEKAPPAVAENKGEQKLPSEPVSAKRSDPVASNSATKVGLPSSSQPENNLTAQNLSGVAETIKTANGAVLVREDDPDRVLHIDVDLEHS
jgi:hypothetical protein